MLQKEEARKLGRRIVSRVNRLNKRLGVTVPSLDAANSSCYEGSNNCYRVHVYVPGEGTAAVAPELVAFLEEHKSEIVLSTRCGPNNYGTCDIPFTPAPAIFNIIKRARRSY